MKTAYLSDKGKVRSINEDGVGVFPLQNNGILAVIADGMGGHNAGEVASAMTINYLSDVVENIPESMTPREAEEWMLEHLKAINVGIFEKAKTEPDCNGMGTTIVAALCYESFTTIAHVGDSRCYKFNQNGVTMLTEDHTLVNELVKNGQITREDAIHHPRKNILSRAIGTEESVEIEIHTREWEEGELLLLCSDGLSNKVMLEEQSTLLEHYSNLDNVAQALVTIANENGGEDNITLALVFNDGSKEQKSS